ncbi:MCE family protein [Nocardioides panacisoli]|uniref:MCE family protein n=1 Tax=Nocardioides panacisoli TaxID=627624 RepID=UPI001C63503F|nr:MlaD family protein [Nocardioides panacisoli]QYJ04869.1 MCE family protein [Nocardioides panacisoli]
MIWVRKVLADRLWLSAAGVVLVLVVAVTYMFAAVLDAPLTERPINLDVELAQTGGLFEGSAVTYRGIKVGKVQRIVPREDGGALATLRVRAGTEVPTDSVAKVRSLSPVGEQYLDFQPNTSEGPFYADGDTVAAESTDLPKSLQSTVIAVNDVLRQIDDEKLGLLLDELSTGLSGTGDDLGRIVGQVEEILATLDEVWPETDRVITNADTVLDIATDNADSLRRLATNAKDFAAFLADYRGEFADVLANTPANLADLEGVVTDAGEVLPGFLETGASFSAMFRPWNTHFRALLQEYPRGLATLSRILGDGALSLTLITADTARCDYGTTRTASERPETGFQPGGQCAATFARLQRGAAHAPGADR